MSGFTPLQEGYLQGFMDGMKVPFLGTTAEGTYTGNPAEAEPEIYGTPVEDLCKEEVIKYEQNGLDCCLLYTSDAADD